MAFQLTITAGLGEGKSFTFDQAETRIGRTSDNDVVLFDPGVSRRHARIFERDGTYFAEDLQSANGTRVNGEFISGVRPLKSGDQVVVGPVVFLFETFGDEAPVAGQETRIVSRATVLPTDRTVTDSEMESQREASTRGIPAVKVKDALAQRQAAAVEPAPAAPPRPVRTGSGRQSAVAPRAPSTSASARTRVPREGGLSAAERARLRREFGDSLGGQLAFLWAQMSRRDKILTASIGSLVALGTLAGLLYLFMPEDLDTGPTGPEPAELSTTPTEDSFGVGDGVTWYRPDMKVFDFQFTTPTRAVVVLHFRARDISENEVSIIVNGLEQGFVPPDVGELVDREIEHVLAPNALKRGERNQLIFDNVRNPPDEQTWRVQGLWIEVVPIPELSAEDTIKSAQEYATRGRTFYEQREVGSENLFRAWKNYRNAWLSLEALDAKPELYATVRFQMNALKRELDQLCGRLMLDAERSIQLKDRRRAKQTLDEVPRYFPTSEHRCHNLARQKLYEYDL